MQWVSGDSKIARVSSNGLVSARKPGTTTITAIVNGKRISCKVTVTSISKYKK